MSLFRRLRRRLRALAFRRDVEQELADELQLHIELEQQKNERLGMAPNEARRAALVTFGGLERYKEEARDARATRCARCGARLRSPPSSSSRWVSASARRARSSAS
jgi:hypothetical protein